MVHLAGWWLYRDIFSQEPAVAKGDPAGAIHACDILVELAYFMTTPVLSHLVGLGPDWFWIRTWLPTAKGGSLLVCSDHLSAAFICLFLRAFSLAARVSLQVGWGMEGPGKTGMKSLIGLPNTHWAGDSFVSGFGVLRYWSMARCCRCRASVSSSPCVPVLSVMSRLIVFSEDSSPQPLLCSWTVGVWEGNWGQPVMYSPLLQELAGGCSNELRTTVWCALIRDAVGDEYTA